MTPQENWARCKPWIEASRVVSPLPESMASIEANLANGNYMLVSSQNSAALVEMASYEGNKAAVIRFGGGDMDELLNVVEPLVCADAKARGRGFVVSEGRMGWKKPAEQHGYKLAWITMIKEV